MATKEAINAAPEARVVIEAESCFPAAKEPKSVPISNASNDPDVIFAAINGVDVVLGEFLRDIPFDVDRIARHNWRPDIGQVWFGVAGNGRSPIAIQSKFADKCCDLSAIPHFNDQPRVLSWFQRIGQPNSGNGYHCSLALNEGPYLKHGCDRKNCREKSNYAGRLIDRAEFLEQFYGPIGRKNNIAGAAQLLLAVIIDIFSVALMLNQRVGILGMLSAVCGIGLAFAIFVRSLSFFG